MERRPCARGAEWTLSSGTSLAFPSRRRSWKRCIRNGSQQSAANKHAAASVASAPQPHVRRSPRERMNRTISSRVTPIVKFGHPLLLCALLAWAGVDTPGECTCGRHTPQSHHRFFQLLLILAIPVAASCVWESVVAKRVQLSGDRLIVSDYFQSQDVPLSTILSVSQSRWMPTHATVKIALKSECLGRNVIRLIPSRIAELEANGKRPFWQQFRWHQHPIVAELNQMIVQRGEPSPAPYGSPVAGSPSGEA